jgi:3-oxoacyl-[acyl-carrier-protein] synthase II
MLTRRRAVITGVGVVSPFGFGASTFWEHIARGESAARPIDSFDTAMLPVKFGAPVPLSNGDLDQLLGYAKAVKTMSRTVQLIVIAANEAVRDAELDTRLLDPYRVGTSLGMGGLGLNDVEYTIKLLDVTLDSIDKNGSKTQHSAIWKNTLERTNPLTPLKALPNMAAAHLAIAYNARGHCQTISTACTSGTQAIGEACRLIQSDVCDVVLAGAGDSMVNPNGLVAFALLGVLSRNNAEYATAARPFDRRRDGFMVGEGAAMFVVEELEHARGRGAPLRCEIKGYASTNDAFRLTDEPPEAWGSIEAMRRTLADARVSPTEIDYINAHGTGTRMNDKTETLAIKSVFGEHAYSLPVSSTKSMIGHLVAAAGSAECAACVLAMDHGVIPPTINYAEADPECDLDYVTSGAREGRLELVLSNSFGFGGQNACLLLAKHV